ncbi:hypothetical protein M434DRAFT_145446 [Hypoxylon sp. CO27-5]|nr:hypothetical protein M434DRAFT_145446 [Hypoxylon sp. CO27-5]
MQRLTRQFVTTASRLSSWCELPNTVAGAEALLLRTTNPLLFQLAAWQSPTTPPGVYCQYQIRGFRIPASLRSKEETVAKGRKKKKSEPLQILFCGSDEFSDASLLALFKEHKSNQELIHSIDVVVRPGKPTGRGNKVIQYPTTREVAERLDVPIHERDTFTGWNMPPGINLIIAVSFGLFVPPRLLRQAKYGGLNLHPSYLPDLRGPAPLQHAILAGRSFTGVTLQTLDAARFDHGLVLARSSPVPIPEDCRFEDLLTALSPIAADLLIQGLRDGVHVPPLEEAVSGAGVEARAVVAAGKLLPAPKITTQDRQILPSRVPHMQRRNRALGPLWFWSRDRRGARKRVIVKRVWGEAPDPVLEDANFVFTVDSAESTPSTLLLSASTDSGSGLAAETLVQLKEVAAAYASTSRVGRCTPYLVPLEADIGASANHRNNGQTKSNSSSNNSSDQSTTGEIPKKTYMVLWIPEARTESCYIGLTRIDEAKVEGDAEKPAAQALKNFLVPLDLDGEKASKTE